MPHCVHPSIHPSIHPMQAAVGESPHLPPPRGHLQSRSVDVAIAITDALHYDIVSKKRVHPKTTAASCRDPRLSQVIYISIYTNRPTERASGSWARRARTTQTHLPVVYIHIYRVEWSSCWSTKSGCHRPTRTEPIGYGGRCFSAD